MSLNIKDQIEVRRELLIKLSNVTKDKLKRFPNGKVYVKHNRNCIYYYLVDEKTGSEEKILDTEKEYISELLQRNYLERVLKAVESELTVLDRLKRNYPKCVAEDVYDKLSKERQDLVKPIIPTDEQFISRWLEKPYVQKPIPDKVPVFETMKGERVRSKSEQLIADRLFVNGIPYKYECPLKVGDRIVHPDFTVLRLSDRKELYHEHLGKLGDDDYCMDNIPKINEYILNGFMPGDSLFMTFESAKRPLDVRVIDKLIEEKFR